MKRYFLILYCFFSSNLALSCNPQVSNKKTALLIENVLTVLRQEKKYIDIIQNDIINLLNKVCNLNQTLKTKECQIDQAEDFFISITDFFKHLEQTLDSSTEIAKNVNCTINKLITKVEEENSIVLNRLEDLCNNS